MVSRRGEFRLSPHPATPAENAASARRGARYNCAFAGVAQSVEQLIRNEKVGCSIHLSGTNTAKKRPLSIR